MTGIVLLLFGGRSLPDGVDLEGREPWEWTNIARLVDGSLHSQRAKFKDVATVFRDVIGFLSSVT